ncbi:hypothetical protein Hanom_Chr17g01554101 [Helianthus anomalus]
MNLTQSIISILNEPIKYYKTIQKNRGFKYMSQTLKHMKWIIDHKFKGSIIGYNTTKNKTCKHE